MNLTRYFLLICLLLTTAACATRPPKACTAEWIEYEINDIYADFRRDSKSELKSFRVIADALENPDAVARPWLAFHMINLAKDVERVVDSYVDIYQSRIETIADTCDRPELVVDALGEFLRQEGAPELVVDMLSDISELSREQTDD
mgnify:CR=1 FL=1